MPVTLLAVLWMAWRRSGRSEQARFARVAAALRSENATLGESLRSLGQHLADAQQQLSDQARIVQQLGLDAAARLHESSDRLANNASVIANANEQLARSGDVDAAHGRAARRPAPDRRCRAAPCRERKRTRLKSHHSC